MTNNEAAEILKGKADGSERYQEAMDKAITALKKNVPRRLTFAEKVVVSPTYYYMQGNCPTCGALITGWHDRCPYCDQKLVIKDY